MKVPSRTMSRPDSIVCPGCGCGELTARWPDLAGCGSCGRAVSGAALRTLEEIAALPDALGKRACECDHPEMRLLPDGTAHCPACGSEVTPVTRPHGARLAGHRRYSARVPRDRMLRNP